MDYLKEARAWYEAADEVEMEEDRSPFAACATAAALIDIAQSLRQIAAQSNVDGGAVELGPPVVGRDRNGLPFLCAECAAGNSFPGSDHHHECDKYNRLPF